MNGRLVVTVVAAVATAAVGIGASYGGDDRKDAHVASGSEQARQFARVAGEDTAAAARLDRTGARCTRGTAGEFPCQGIDMLSHVPAEDLGLSFVNDIWGWTDRGDDYALVGGTEGTVFVDISRPRRPDIVGTLPSSSLEGGEFWRDIKVYRNHAYIVSEHTGHQMQVFDLTELRGVEGPPVTFEATTVYDVGGNGNTHNLNINKATGFAYLVGTSTCEGGLHMVDLDTPAEPTYAGCFDDHGYIHDTQCVVYRGPDKTYRGREICFNANATQSRAMPDSRENTLSIVDVTDKSAPVPLSRVFYGNDGYSHQGWLAKGQRYYLHGDELDEMVTGARTRTRVWDVSNLDRPTVTGTFTNTTTSIDHNLYTKGNRSYHSNYTSGLRIYDLSRLQKGRLSERAWFDLYPENDAATFEGGTWSNYPYFKGERFVATSSIDRGLFVLQPRGK